MPIANGGPALRAARPVWTRPGLMLAAVFPTMLLPGSAHAQADDAIKAALEPRYAALRQAMEARDGPAIKALLTKDFQSTDLQGNTTDADEMIEDLNRWQNVRGRGMGGRGMGERHGPGGAGGPDMPPPPGAGAPPAGMAGAGAGGPPPGTPPGPPPGPPSERKVETSFVSLTVTGDTALARRKRDMSGKRVGPDGAPHSFEMISFTDDTWKQVGGTWLLKSTVAREMTMLRDGQEMRHMVAGEGGQ